MLRCSGLVLAGLIFCAAVFAQTPSSTALIASPNPSNYGQPVTLTATVTSGATGKVTFYDGVTILGVGTLSGTQASLTTVMLQSGKRMLQAYYQGDGTYAPSRSTSLAQTVAAGSSSGFQRATTYPRSAGTSGIAVGDFNGDSRQDLVMVSGLKQVSVYLGNGDGTFQNAADYLTGCDAYTVVVGDFNADGKMDLAFTCIEQGTVSILLGNGDGTFQAPSQYPVGPYPDFIAVADFNGDGRADLVVGNLGGSLDILLGNGDGTFQSASFVPFGCTLPAVADFNGDGFPDLVVAIDSQISLLLGNGDGTFRAAGTILTGADYVYEVAAADFNGDGLADVLVSFGSTVAVLPGKGDGTFGARLNSTAYNQIGVIADFNGDGILDLAFFLQEYDEGGIYYNGVAVAPGKGDGTFGATVYYELPGVSVGIVGDFNGDGKADLAIAAAYNSYSVLLGGGFPDLAIAASHGLPTVSQGTTYTITVTNVGSVASLGTVKVSVSIPPGLVPTAVAGDGWSCVPASLTCTRGDSVAAGASYSIITLRVNVANGFTGYATTTFTISGGGDVSPANNSASDTVFIRNATATTLASSPNPSTFGQPVALTASVSAGATGRVQFYEDATPLGSAAIASGKSTFTTSLLPPGAVSLIAVYTGDSSLGPSTSTAQTQIVTPISEDGLMPYTSYKVDASPSWIVAADLNGDGRVDLVTVNYGNSDISVLLGNSDGTFQPALSYTTTGPNPYSAVVGDFNNDGKPDMAVTTATGIFLLPGNGDGTFQIAQPVSSPTGYSVLTAADFNGDGIPDLAALNGGVVVLLLGNGDGTFQPPVNLSSSNTSFSFLKALDVNGDGNADLLAYAPGELGVYLGNGDGTFRALSSSPLYGGAAAVGDYTGDGKPDVVIAYWAGVSVLPGNGDGTFGTAIPTGLSSLIGSYVFTGDFNGDGKLDLAYADYTDSGITFAFANGDGTFLGGPSVPLDYPAVAMVQGDFNGDGKPDFAVATANSTVDVFLGGRFSGLNVSANHSGNFISGHKGTYRIVVENPAFASSAGTVTVTDTLPSGLTASTIGGSGWNCTLSPLACTCSDVLTTEVSYPPITLVVNVAASLTPSTVTNSASVTMGGILKSATDPTTIVSPTATALAVGPNPSTLGQSVTLTASVTAGRSGTVLFFDGGIALASAPVSNGIASASLRLSQSGLRSLTATYSGDATHGSSSSSEIPHLVKATPATGFADAASYATGLNPLDIAAGDFNQDGITDLVTANFGANTVSVLLGRGDGTFGPHVEYPAGQAPIAVAVADFNNDGWPDIAVSNERSQDISILLGKGDGTFQAPINFAASDVSALVATDLNGDGIVDLLANSANLTVLFGNGNGTFQPAVAIPGPSPAAVADFNGDGIVDIATPDLMLLGQGDGTFQPTPFSITSYPWTLTAGDLNADGKPDILTTDRTGVSVILGNGDGTFQTEVFYGTGTIPKFALTADINGDGKLDVVAVNPYDKCISLLLGNGDGTLQPPTLLSAGSLPVSAVSGDFNGDGRTDLAIVDFESNSVIVLLGVLTPTLAISSSHSGPFAIGQSGDTYTITVTNTGPGVTSGTVTVTDTLPTGLTATAIGGTNWNCTLATLTCTTTDSLAAGHSYLPIVVTVNVTATTTGTGPNQVGVFGGGAATANAFDSTTIVGPAITIQTSPTGLQFTVDGAAAQTAAQTINLAPGTHTIAVQSPQAGPPGTQYAFTGWSDSGAASHTITITIGTAPATYTAIFKTQYQLTTTPNPEPGGTVSPASGTYVDAGSAVTLAAIYNSPYEFTSWTGGATSNPLQLTMNAPTSVTATFNVPGFTCAVKTGASTPTVADVQQIVNEALGVMPPNDDLNHDNVVNVADVQKVIGALLDLGCLY